MNQTIYKTDFDTRSPLMECNGFLTHEGKFKRNYMSPQVNVIDLDNQISLALESSPPIGPNEELSMVESFTSNPYV